jgi:hypothetical protein
MPAPRILLADMFFPTASAAWRIDEIQHFVSRFETDVLAVHNSDAVLRYLSGQNRSTADGLRLRQQMFEPAWRSLNTSHHLWRYDILIFRKEWNWLQRYNDPAFDGRAFNGQAQAARHSADYMLRLRSHRSPRLDLSSYDAYYHIFCWVFSTVAALIDATPARRAGPISAPYRAWGRHVIKAWPGAGALGCSLTERGPPACQCKATDDADGCIAALTPSRARGSRAAVRVITTQAHVHDCLRRGLPRHPHFTLIPGAPTSNVPPPRPMLLPAADPLSVCLTVAAPTRAHQQAKGVFVYFDIVDRYFSRYPEGRVAFHGVGSGVPPHPHVHTHGHMTQHDLDAFYRSTPISIVFDLAVGNAVRCPSQPFGLFARPICV